MNRLFLLLQKVPFFSHINYSEFEYLKNNFNYINLSAGKVYNLKNDNKIYIIQNGFLEILSSTGKKESVFLQPGSFFGEIPFVENIARGSFKAVIDTTLLVLDIKLLYQLFFVSYKFSRGYIKSFIQNNIRLNNSGLQYFNKNTKIITVTGYGSKCGKTLIASYLATALENHDKTILLDISYKGDSLFNIFNKKLTLAISQRDATENTYKESFIYDRICQISETLSILNISFAAKVKMNPDIISPIIFMLSKMYKYIVIDLGGDDTRISKSVYNCSDIILPILKKEKNILKFYEELDLNLNDGQRVIYIINIFYKQNIKNNKNYIFFPDIKIENNENIYAQLKENINQKDQNNNFDLINRIIDTNKAVVLNSNDYSDIAYSGLLNIFFESNYNITSIHASFIGYIISIFYILSGNSKEFIKYLSKFFKDERLRSVMNIVFPSDYVFDNDKLNKYSYDLFKNKRIENYRLNVSGIFMDNNMHKKVFSSGYINKLFTAAFLLYPLCKSLNISKKSYHSGFPFYKATDSDLLRTDIDEVIFCNIKNSTSNKKKRNKKNNIIDNYLSYFNFKESNLITRKKLVIDACLENNKMNDLIIKNESKWLSEIDKIKL